MRKIAESGKTNIIYTKKQKSTGNLSKFPAFLLRKKMKEGQIIIPSQAEFYRYTVEQMTAQLVVR